MRKALRIIVTGTCCACLLVAALAQAATLNVPGSYATIQAAVTAASSGDVVSIAAGTYNEQVNVDGKNVTLQGAGRGLTFVTSPAVLVSTFATGGPVNKPIVTAQNSGDIRIQDLTVDGLNLGNSNSRFEGIAFWNAGGKILNCDIVNIADTPLSGLQHGVSVYTYNNTGGPYALEMGGVNMSHFQKNATALSGSGLTVDVHDCTATGNGNVANMAQNGIQLGYGAGGSIANCTISSLRYTTDPSAYVASGILVYEAGSPVTVSGLVGAHALTDVQVPVYWADANGSVNGVQNVGGADSMAVFVANYNASAPGRITSQSVKLGDSRITASPFDPESGALGSASPGTGGALSVSQAASAPYSVTLNACALTGIASPGTPGIFGYTAGAGLDITVTNSTVTNWDYGLYAYGAALSMNASHNSIYSNTTAGYDNSASGHAQDITNNWWGSGSGPGGVGPGTGDAVSGSNLSYTPWLSGPYNAVTAAASGSFLSSAQPALNVAVGIAHTGTGIRGYSVTFQLTNLTLNGSVTSGSYLPNPNFHVTDNLDGTFTVDEVTLGSPCGDVAPTGTLFNIPVASSLPSGTGTVTLTNVTLRDCLNHPLPATTGDPVSIDIDNTPPVAMAGLAATPLTTGNDADGTIRVRLTWPAVEAGASVKVYRAGYGNYPTYAGGSVPSSAAAPGAPWALTPVAASGQNDELATPRDFYYYVAFVTDVHGNVSAVSNVTVGALNYELGDVHDGLVAGHGDNLVNTSDVSHLGFYYGLPVGAGAGHAPSYLDFGPTTTEYVDGRPLPDGRVNFEDLILLAINYHEVSKPVLQLARATRDELRTEVSGAEGSAIGSEIRASLMFRGTGMLQGISSRLAWNHAVVEPVSAGAGALLTEQGGVAFSAQPGTVDLALLGVHSQGLAGEGELASVTFRRIAAGEPGIALESVDARDASNHKAAINGVAPAAVAPSVTALMASTPNPFRSSAALRFSLKSAGSVELAIFSVEGRRVRTLVSGARDAGLYQAVWNGRDERGAQVSPGVFYARLRTGQGTFTRPVTFLK